MDQPAGDGHVGRSREIVYFMTRIIAESRAGKRGFAPFRVVPRGENFALFDEIMNFAPLRGRSRGGNRTARRPIRLARGFPRAYS